MECRVYRGPLNNTGYGFARLGSTRSVLLHRWVWEQINGPIPDKMVIRHTCDNRGCFLYEHLLIGTQADNVQDRVDRARGIQRGETHTLAVLTDEQVADIRSRLNASPTVLAREFGCSRSTISNIRRGFRRNSPQGPGRPI